MPWSPRCRRPQGLTPPVRTDPTGQAGPTRHQAAGRHWRQTSAGLYVRRTVDGRVVEQQILEQAGRIRAYGAVTAWAALRWHGAAFFDGLGYDGEPLPVPLILDSSIRPDPRFTQTEERLAPTEMTLVDGVPVTSVQRALFDEVRRVSSVREAALAIAMTAAAKLISTDLFAMYVARRRGWTGVPHVREAVALSVDDCWSPQEFRMLMIWLLDAELDPPLRNPEVFDRQGRLIGVPDLLDPVAGVVGEYQGEDHKSGPQHRKDVAREQRFRDHGLEVFELVGGDVADRDVAVTRMLRARRRARFLSPEVRSWTLEPPPWRRTPESVHDYLVRTGQADQLCRT